MPYTQPFTTTALTSSLRRALDLPIWEWLRFSPYASAAGHCTSTSETGTDRYIYYLTSQAAPNAFWRYDTITDGWQNLASPYTALVSPADMRYSAANGFRCRALTGSNASMLIMPTLTGQIFSGSVVKIIEGTGRGQYNVITSVSDPVIQDHGVLNAATATQLTDTTKKWKYNQWAGYQCRLSFDAGAGQVRNVLYNDSSNLYFSDPNYQQIDSWNNNGFSATSPFSAPVATAGSQTHYTIEAGSASLQTTWSIVPDVTSKLIVYTGGLWCIASAAAAPWFTYQYYNVAADTWVTKSSHQTILTAAPTDLSLERFAESVGYFGIGGGLLSGPGGSSPTASLFYSSAQSASFYDISNTGSISWPADKFVDYQCRIISGSGQGQRRRIIAMTGSSFQVTPNWNVQPDSSSVYAIYGDTDKIMAFFGGNSLISQYQIEPDLWTMGDAYYTGLARNWSALWYGSQSYESVALSSITKYSGSIMSMSVVVGGTGFYVGDTFALGGSNYCFGGKGRVTSVGFSGSASSSVLGVEIYAVGNGYISGSLYTASVLLGSGSNFTCSIYATGSAGRITTAINHWFQRNDMVTIQGTTDATWNQPFAILGVDGLTTFDITGSSTVAPTAVSSSGANTFVDAAANWTINELVGKYIRKYLVGYIGTNEAKRIISNTSNTVTVNTNWTANPVNGTGRYAIEDPKAFGRDEQFRNPTLNGRGYAAGGSTTSLSSSLLYDATHNWLFNQWSGSIIRFTAGTGINNECLVYTNNANTMSFYSSSIGSSSMYLGALPGVLITPDTSSKYVMFDSFGTCTSPGSATTLVDYSKNWTVNQWAGKIVRVTAGTDNGFVEVKVASNTNNTLTVATLTTATANDTSYVIYSTPQKGTGLESNWIWGTTNSSVIGKYIWVPLGGGSNRFERYDITQQLWECGIYIQPMTETLTTGTMYAYDGTNRLYFTVNATGRVMYIDLSTNRVVPFGMTPYAQGAALVGNRMEVITTPDGLQFLVIFRHTGQEIWRSLIVA